MVSSHDRTGGNVDGGSYGGAGTGIGLTQTFVRRAGSEYVMYEHDGPGCITRTFFATAGPPLGSAEPFGRLKVFIDGEAEPSFDEELTEFYAGRVSGYPGPLVGDQDVSSGGTYSYVPFCFNRSVEVRTTGVPVSDGIGWWQMNLLLAPDGTKVEPFDRATDMSGDAGILNSTGMRPRGKPEFTASRVIVDGAAELPIARLGGAGTVEYLRFAVDPFDIETLRALSLRVSVGGRPPDIDVPLASLFGDGIETRPIDAAGFGMDPAAGTGYFALPIPFRRGGEIELVAADGAKAEVTVDGWLGPKVPKTAGRLIGEYHVEQAAEGSDTRIIDTAGSGRLASVVMDILDGGPASGQNPLQRFLEGDERIHIDGSRSPSFYGTGHEEFSNAGFYFANGAFTRELGGAGPLGSTPGGAGTQSQYRVFADDGPRWSSAIEHGHEHGGGDEQPAQVGVTSFSYRARPTLTESDQLLPADAASASAHELAGASEATELSAYFEGDLDGNSTTSTVVIGGSYYPAPDPATSPQGLTAQGIRFAGPITARLDVDPDNEGVVLRGLFDQQAPFPSLAVEIDGKPAGTWAHPAGIPTSWKRWLEDDFDIRPGLTRGKDSIRVTLTPQADAGVASIFALETLSRHPLPG